MKRLILLELILLFLASTFTGDSPAPGWVQQTLPRTDITVQDICFIDSLKGWVVTRKNTNDSAFIYHTIDGGNSWTTQFAKNVYLTSIQFVDSNTGYSVGSAPPGIIYKTINGGLTWNLVSTLTAYPLVDVKFVNKDTGWVCDPDVLFGGLFKTTTGGTSWQQQLVASYRINKLFFLNKDTGWAASTDNKLYRTNNGGMNWGLQFTFSAGIAKIFFINKDSGYVAGGFGTHSIKRTTNGGNTWDTTYNSQNGKGLFFINKTTGWNSDVFSIVQKTTNGGLSWYRQTVPSGYYYNIQFTDTNLGWSGGTILIHTTDGGGPPVGIIQISNEIPNEFKLYQNYPNPFNPVTKIRYQAPLNPPKRGKSGKAFIQLKVYDITGKEITTLVNEEQSAGTYEVDFSATGGGLNLSSGIYFYSLIADGKLIDTKRMVLVK